MHINDDHLYHGAALTQVAEHPSFKAINGFREAGELSRSAFVINRDIGLYLKYASKPTPAYNEYIFTFHQDSREELEILRQKMEKVFIGLVCVENRQICCLPYESFLRLIRLRKKEKGSDEWSYIVLVTVPGGGRFRVYINSPGKKGKKLGERKIPRTDFPSALFQ